MSEAQTATSRMIGEIFVERGLVTAEQLEGALAMQVSTGDRLGEILVAHFGVPRLELASALAEQWSVADDSVAAVPEAATEPARSLPSLEEVEREVEEIDRRPIGEIFLQSGFVTAEELERALVAQRETGQRLGEVLVAQGSITRLELASALAEQWAGLPKLRPPAPQQAADNGTPAAPPLAETPPVAAPTVEPSVRSDARLDELAARIDALSADVASGAELRALRDELRILAERPTHDATLATRVDELAHRLQAMGDVASLRAALAGRVDEIETKVHAVGALDGDLHALRTSIDELRAHAGIDAEARARLDSLTAQVQEQERVVAPSPAADVNLAGRLDDLERELRAAAAAADVREAFGAVREEMREIAARLEDTPDVEALTRRLDGIDARLSDSSERHSVHTAIAELQTELAALGGRDEKGRLESLVERLDALESGLPAPEVLDTLRDDVAQLLARPAIDPGYRPEDVASLLEQHSALAGDVEELRATIQASIERLPVDTGLAERLEAVSQEVQELAARSVTEPDQSLPVRLAELEERVAQAASAQDVREAFAAVRDEMSDVAGQLDELVAPPDLTPDVEGLRAAVAGLADRPAVDADARERLESLAAAVDDIARRLPTDDTLAPRLAEVERRVVDAASADDVREAFAAVREEVSEIAAQFEQIPALDAFEGRLEAVEHRASDRSDVETVRSAVAELRGEVKALEARDDRGRFDAVHARLDELERSTADAPELDALRADVQVLREQAQASREQIGQDALDRLGERIDELEARAPATTDLEELRAELALVAARPVGDPAVDTRLETLTDRLDRLDADSARNEDLVALRDTVSRLELRPSADPTLPARLGELARRAETWQAAAEGVEELDRRVTELAARPLPDPGLAERLGAVTGRVDELAAADITARDRLAALGDAIERLELRPDPHADLPARLGALAGRVDLVEPMSQRLEELSARVEELSAPDPATSSRLLAIERTLAEDAERQLTARAEVEAAVSRVDDELVVLRDDLRASAAAAAQGTSDLEAALQARLHEAIAESRGLSEDAERETAAKVDEVARRLEALDVLAGRAESLEADGKGLRKQVDELSQASSGLRALVEQSVESVSASARADNERLQETVEELAAAVGRRDETLESMGWELSGRIDDLAAAAAVDAGAREALAEVRETLSRLGATVAETAGVHGRLAEQVDVTAAELGARIDDLALRVVQERAEEEQSIRADFGELAARLEEVDAAGVVARDDTRAEVERLTASIGWRLERVEESLAADDTEELRRALAAVEKSLAAQEARQDEQVRVTERALRKGLASLGARLADSEAEYVQAGNTLRRSIERLGSAIVEADVAVTERGDEQALALHHANATSYVAFAPTADGYRLVAVDGPAPATGERITLAQCDGDLVVTRVGASPIPLDTRPCAYLERA